MLLYVCVPVNGCLLAFDNVESGRFMIADKTPHLLHMHSCKTGIDHHGNASL